MKVEKVSGNQLLSNSFWKFLESIGGQMILLIISIVLARILSPSDYGLMAIVTVALTFLGLFIGSGIASYLIYISDIRKQDVMTAMVINVILSVFLLLVLLFMARYIADFYESPQLLPIIRVMSITLPFSAISSIYNAFAMKMSLYKTLFYRNLFVLPISGALALLFAYLGFGVWALVVQSLSSCVLLTIVFVVAIDINIDGEWRMDKAAIVPMFKFGGFTFLSTLIAFIGDNISDLMIGKKINAEQLGYYSRGCHIPFIFSNVINGVLAGVLFPAFASFKSDIKELKDKFRKTLRLMNYIVIPFFFCLIAVLKPFVLVLLTDKWMMAIPVAQIICFYSCLFPFLQISSQVYLATGHVKIRTICELLKMVIMITLLFSFIGYGILAVSYVRVTVNVVLVLFTMVINKHIILYSYKEFVYDMVPPFLLGALLNICISPINLLFNNNLLVLIIQILLSLFLYFVCIRLFKMKEVEDLLSHVIFKRNKM